MGKRRKMPPMVEIWGYFVRRIVDIFAITAGGLPLQSAIGLLVNGHLYLNTVGNATFQI